MMSGGQKYYWGDPEYPQYFTEKHIATLKYYFTHWIALTYLLLTRAPTMTIKNREKYFFRAQREKVLHEVRKMANFRLHNYII